MVHQGRRLAIGFLVLICSVNQGTLSADISLPTPSLPRRGSRTRLPPVVARVGTSGQLANAAGFVSAPGRAAALAPHSDVATCKRLGAAPALGPVMFWGESLMDNAGAWARGIRAPSALPPHKMSAVKALEQHLEGREPDYLSTLAPISSSSATISSPPPPISAAIVSAGAARKRGARREKVRPRRLGSLLGLPSVESGGEAGGRDAPLAGEGGGLPKTDEAPGGETQKARGGLPKTDEAPGGETQKARGGGLAKGAAGLQKGAADLQKGQQHLAHMLASLTIPRVAASRLEHLAVLARTWVKLGKHSDEVLGKTSNAGLPGAGGKQRAGEAGDHPGGVAPWDALRQELAGLAAGAGLAPPDGAARAVTVGGVEGAGREEDMALEARIAEAMRSYGSSASNLYARASSSWPHLDASWLAHATLEALAAFPETVSRPARAVTSSVTDATGRAVTSVTSVTSSVTGATGRAVGGAVDATGRVVGGAVSEASRSTQAAMAQLDRVREGLGALLDKEVRVLVTAVERELLSLQRQGKKGAKRGRAAVCMVLDARGTARVLRLGDSVPELLYSDVQGAALFDAPMMVSLDADEDGNVFLCAPGDNRGTPLPLASDVLWLRQMASYSLPQSPSPPAASAGGDVKEGGKSWELPEAAAVTVAAVTLPVSARGDLLVTQRAFRGMYDGMWVFPGGHVDGGEGLSAAASREVREETGVEVSAESLQPLAVWEGTVSSKKRQFCVVFFAGQAIDARELRLQEHEVHRAAWVPRELLPRLLDTHTRHTSEMVPAFSPSATKGEGASTAPPVSLAEIQAGLGEGHKFALRCYLDSLDKKPDKKPSSPASYR